jgi:hypothetical protein
MGQPMVPTRSIPRTVRLMTLGEYFWRATGRTLRGGEENDKEKNVKNPHAAIDSTVRTTILTAYA